MSCFATMILMAFTVLGEPRPVGYFNIGAPCESVRAAYEEIDKELNKPKVIYRCVANMQLPK